MSKNVFVSPGVYTSEKDLSYVTSSIGVTTLGLAGETTMGPAFQPIFISNYNEFTSFFGGLDATLVKDTLAPKYELGYIAKSYLAQANQLFVTRVLGLSGYDAGQAWGLVLDAALDSTTVVTTQTATTFNPLLSYTATTGGTLVNVVSSDSLVQTLYNDGLLDSQLVYLGASATGVTGTINPTYYKTGSNFLGASFNLYTLEKGTSGIYVTGITTGATIHYSGVGYTDVENKVIGLLRSRGGIDSVTQLPSFEITGSTDIVIDTTNTAVVNDSKASFVLSGNSTLQGNVSYSVSLDNTKRDYIVSVLGRGAQDGQTSVFVEEFFKDMFEDLYAADKVKGLKQTLVQYDNDFKDYLNEYQAAETPYIVSELKGNKVLRLFKFITISDGNTANEMFKISITNIKPDDKEFDVEIRSYADTDANPVRLEVYSKCTMDPNSNNFIGRKIGTTDGVYPSISKYVLLELETSSDTSGSFPAGFAGYPIRDYQTNGQTSVVSPTMQYKKAYSANQNKNKYYLGISDTVGIDSDLFDYKGVPFNQTYDSWTGLTKGFHMDINASGVTIDNVVLPLGSGTTYSPIFLFDTGAYEFKTDADLVNTDYEKLNARKFTVAPYGGFDGWDVYRTRRSNTDDFLKNAGKGVAGKTFGAFKDRPLSNGDAAINSDYYAYLEAIWTFKNPEAVSINLLGTPGIDNRDNTNLVESTIEMVENDRGDALYVMTTPDTNNGVKLTADEAVNIIDGAYDSNYSCTYWPWLQINDSETNHYVWIPPTRDVIANIAFNDKNSFPWFATAGVNRGKVGTDVVQVRKTLTLAERDTLYENRINPMAKFTTEGIVIWGNKTLQIKDTALNRINVRRLLLQARKLVSAVGIKLLFEQNDSAVRNQFLSQVNPILENIRVNRGLTDFRVVVSNSPEDYDRNQLTGQIFLKPTRSLEFVQLEFVITNTSASFNG